MFGYPQQMRGNGGAAGPLPFIFSVTVGSGQSFQLPTISGGTYDCIVDWGDTTSSTLTVWNVGRSHTYAVGGTYDIRITGVFNGWSVSNYADRLKITEVKQWGSLLLGTGSGAFHGCANMTVSAIDILDTASCTSFQNLFTFCTSLTSIPSVENWDTSGVHSMFGAFNGCELFNAPIGAWDMSSVTSFQNAFINCKLLDADLSTWDVSAVTSFNRAFDGCTSLNFDASDWVVSSVKSMNSMFRYCEAFTSDLSTWDVSSVTNIQYIFDGCTAFSSDLSAWDTSSVIGQIGGAFRNCPLMDFSLASWDITGITVMGALFTGGGLSTVNYDATLIGWASQSVQSGVIAGMGSSEYTSGGAAEAARNTLINTYGWSITDGGPV